MIPEVLEDMFFQDRNELIIPAENVAVLRTENHLYHAMLILSNNYVTLPVLDEDDHVCGKMTMSAIVRATTTMTGYDMDLLENLKVKDVMEPCAEPVREDAELEEILRALQDANYLCTVDENNRFTGMITRKEVMGRVSRVFHGLNREYEWVPKARNRREAEYAEYKEYEEKEKVPSYRKAML